MYYITQKTTRCYSDLTGRDLTDLCNMQSEQTFFPPLVYLCLERYRPAVVIDAKSLSDFFVCRLILDMRRSSMQLRS